MELDTTTCYIGLGSNLGNRAGNLLLAVRGLMEAGFNVSRLSAIYETSPVGVEDHDDYLNMVAEVLLTNISPTQMLARLIRLEYLLGRRHKFTKAPRTVDLDILIFGDTVIDSEFLRIPHPRLHLRRFVLTPLAELSPHLIIPNSSVSVAEVLEQLDDDSEVVRWECYSNIDEINLLASETSTNG